eukprot:TRINITY_DN1834_c0_g1_i1.p1 TRINITY_DN1834_c0_g1~~TRINITY_DN1834_c0_g1_i1.p1  ORF type:complete len:800 (-),score=136.15 TRINITY_DN1834_c0_g1_i1:51-2450(-)
MGIRDVVALVAALVLRSALGDYGGALGTRRLATQTHPCPLSAFRTVLRATQAPQTMSNANFWLQVAEEDTSTSCAFQEDNHGGVLTCDKPICVFGYRLALAGKLLGQDVNWDIEGAVPGTNGVNLVWSKIASGGPRLESEPAFEITDGIATYPVEACGVTNGHHCETAVPGKWIYLRSATPHTSVNTITSLRYQAFPFYPITAEETRRAFAKFYDTDLASVTVESVTATAPNEHNKVDLETRVVLKSWVELPPFSAFMSNDVQSAYQVAVQESAEYVTPEAERAEVLNGGIVQNPDPLLSDFREVLPVSARLENTPTRHLSVSTVQEGARTETGYTLASSFDSPVHVYARGTLPSGIEPVFQTVSAYQITCASEKHRDELLEASGQALLQSGFADFCGRNLNAVSIDTLEGINGQTVLASGQQGSALKVVLAVSSGSTEAETLRKTIMKDSGELRSALQTVMLRNGDVAILEASLIDNSVFERLIIANDPGTTTTTTSRSPLVIEKPVVKTDASSSGDSSGSGNSFDGSGNSFDSSGSGGSGDSSGSGNSFASSGSGNSFDSSGSGNSFDSSGSGGSSDSSGSGNSFDSSGSGFSSGSGDSSDASFNNSSGSSGGFGLFWLILLALLLCCALGAVIFCMFFQSRKKPKKQRRVIESRELEPLKEAEASPPTTSAVREEPREAYVESRGPSPSYSGASPFVFPTSPQGMQVQTGQTMLSRPQVGEVYQFSPPQQTVYSPVPSPYTTVLQGPPVYNVPNYLPVAVQSSPLPMPQPAGHVASPTYANLSPAPASLAPRPYYV